MEETLKLTCQKCTSDYEKPADFKKWKEETRNNIFFKWSLEFCDKCRKEREREALRALPNVVKVLNESFEKKNK